MPNKDTDAGRAPRRLRALTAAGAAVAGLALIAACSSSGGSGNSTSTGASSASSASSAADTGTSGSGSASSSAAALLPAKYKQAGQIVDASAFDYPPFDFTEANGSYTGIEPDLLQAVAKVLGVKITYQKLSGFASLIPAVSSGRVDMASSSIGVLPERVSQVGYAQYMNLREGLLVANGNPKHIDVNNLCGTTLAVESGAIEVTEYTALSQKCVSAGKPKINVETFSSESSQVLSISAGRADAVAVGWVTCAYIAKQNPSLEVLPDFVDVDNGGVPIGIVTAPTADGAGLAQAVTAAIQELQSDGQLKQLLDKYGLSSQLIDIKYVKSTK